LRIVIATVGSLGDLFPFLALGQELRARGHEVLIGTHGIHRAPVEAAGLAFADASGLPEPENREAYMARAFDRWRGPRFVVHDLAATDTAASFVRLRRACEGADVLVTTTLAFGAQILGETQPLRWFSAVLAPAAFISAYDPPATGVAVLDRFFRASPRRGAWLGRLARRVTRPWTAPVRAFRQTLGLADQSATGDPFHRGQHGRDGVLALYPSMLGEPQPDWPGHVTVCGFARYRQPAAPMASALAAFLDEGKAPLVFTLGSAAVFAGLGFFRESVHAIAQLGERAVLLTGSPELRAALGSLPGNILAVDYASHAALFPHASVVVHHGGIGTSTEALYAGVPALVVPHGFDQPDNAARLQRLGVAGIVPITRYTAARAARTLRQLLGDPRYREAARECARVLSTQDGASAAADVITAAAPRHQNP
jgi:UDP:flavonoid glycosyltransferase YjiC (YdhE family)